MRIRDAAGADAAACAAIYGPFVRDTVVTFEVDVPTAADFAERIAAAQRRHAWLVAEIDDRVAGYAYAQEFKARAAYRFACEVSVYLDAESRHRGVGRALYEALFARLAERGFRVAVAAMTLPNDASVALHRSLGFEPVGIYRRIGWKNDQWHDVALVQRSLAAESDPSDEPF